MAGERHAFRADAIERQLAHVPAGVRGVYNAAECLDERRVLMDVWARYLDALEASDHAPDQPDTPYRTRPDFSPVIERVENAIRVEQFEGAAAGLLDGRIVARMLGTGEMD